MGQVLVRPPEKEEIPGLELTPKMPITDALSIAGEHAKRRNIEDDNATGLMTFCYLMRGKVAEKDIDQALDKAKKPEDFYVYLTDEKIKTAIGSAQPIMEEYRRNLGDSLEVMGDLYLNSEELADIKTQALTTLELDYPSFYHSIPDTMHKTAFLGGAPDEVEEERMRTFKENEEKWRRETFIEGGKVDYKPLLSSIAETIALGPLAPVSRGSVKLFDGYLKWINSEKYQKWLATHGVSARILDALMYGVVMGDLYIVTPLGSMYEFEKNPSLKTGALMYADIIATALIVMKLASAPAKAAAKAPKAWSMMTKGEKAARTAAKTINSAIHVGVYGFIYKDGIKNTIKVFRDPNASHEDELNAMRNFRRTVAIYQGLVFPVMQLAIDRVAKPIVVKAAKKAVGLYKAPDNVVYRLIDKSSNKIVVGNFLKSMSGLKGKAREKAIANWLSMVGKRLGVPLDKKLINMAAKDTEGLFAMTDGVLGIEAQQLATAFRVAYLRIKAASLIAVSTSFIAGGALGAKARIEKAKIDDLEGLVTRFVLDITGGELGNETVEFLREMGYEGVGNEDDIEAIRYWMDMALSSYFDKRGLEVGEEKRKEIAKIVEDRARIVLYELAQFTSELGKGFHGDIRENIEVNMTNEENIKKARQLYSDYLEAWREKDKVTEEIAGKIFDKMYKGKNWSKGMREQYEEIVRRYGERLDGNESAFISYLFVEVGG